MGRFTYVGYMPGKRCAFCKATLSVKYIVDLDISKHNVPTDTIAQPAKVFACNTCVAQKIGEGKLT